MQIQVRKATPDDIEKMSKLPTWGCEISTFDWFYDSEEHCYLTEGQVTVEYDGGSASFGAGDYVILPEGMKCVWKVSKAVRKHYLFM
ncbi:MAG: cupin domain-containing protein [Oscillospiraceae bacterium]|nr:cupin domain-containing protein [Oscillospiraceae bacterium]